MSLRLISAAVALAAAFVLPTARAQFAPLPPSPSVQLAVDPISNKVYAANKDANTVTALDATTGISTTIAVGLGPDFIAVDPTRDRVYVNNTRDASLSVISGAANAVIAPYNIGSFGPIAMNPDPNSPHTVVYIVRMTGAGSDEVTYFSPASPTWYTIATDSFQPGALAVNPVTHTIFVAHYATGDLRIIDGDFTGVDFPHPPSVTMCDNASAAPRCSTSTVAKPFAVAANPVTNKTYVITEHATDSIAVVNGATLGVVFPAIASGHAVGPKALAVNPVTNKIYAAFAGEVVVIDGATNALTYIPIANAGSGAISLGINYSTNRIYAATALGTLSVIDGAANTVESSQAIPVGTSSIGINPITNTIYLYAGGITALAGAAGSAQSIPITTTIAALPGNSSGPSGSISLQASSSFSPTALPVRKVYFRFDSTNGPWTEAPPTGTGSYTANYSGLSAGSHTMFAMAVDDQVAPLTTGPQSIPLVGQIASYSFSVTGNVATPSVSLASSANPSRLGDSVTFTASVAGSAGTPTGTVTFLDGPNTVCSGVALAAGTAACTTTTLSVGSHTIRAQYSGNASYAAASTSLAQVVNPAKVTPSTVSLVSSTNPATQGQAVTFSLIVRGSSGAPTGNVTFRDGTTALCANVALTGLGNASCTTSTLAAGTHSIAADYAGDSNYNAATSNTVAQAVKGSATATLTSSANPSIQGQPVTFTASVSGSSGAPTGTASFTDGGAAIAGCTGIALSAGKASCTAGSLATGAHAIAVQYSGDSAYPAASASLTQTVNARGAPSLALASSANPSNPGQSVTFTLAASGSSGTPTGSVTFKDGTTALCTAVPLASGSASCAAASLSAGTHSISADYAGDASYSAGSSNTVSQVVKAAPSATLASSANPSTQGQAVTFTAAVSGSLGAATGTVAFRDGATGLAGCAAVTLSGGSASCSATLAAGVHTIAADFSGDSRYTAGTTSLSQSVNAPALSTPAVGISSSVNPSTRGDAVTFSASVSGSAGAPTGNVDFLDGSTLISGCTSVPLSSSSAACTTSALATGSHSITARYSGNGAYNAASSSVLTQAVNDPAPVLADLSITQSANPNPASTDSDLTFTLNVANNGPANATGVTVSSAVPTGATFVSATAGCSNSGGNISCTIGSLANGATAAVQVIVRPSNAGTLTHTATASAAQGDPSTANNTTSLSVTVNAPVQSPPPRSALMGVSTRMQVLTGDNVLIGGFIIGGSGAKTVIIRARGPSTGVAGALADPTLTLVPANGDPATTNDDWGNAPNAAQIAASGLAPGDAKESAILATLNPGAYTAIVSGVGGATGVAIVEIFEVDRPEVPLTAISTRGRVQTGDNVMIGGFVIPGDTPRTVVVRARGPSLAPGVADALMNPTLTVVPASGGAAISNDDWGNAPNAAQIAASGFAPSDARESALLLTLPPGAYTAVVAGANNTTGVAIVEVFAQ